MNKDTLIIDGVEYTKTSTIKNFRQNDFMITDPSNVMAIVPTKRNEEIGDIIEISGLSTFSKFEGELKLGELNKKLKPSVFYLGASKYSYDYLMTCIKTSKTFTGSTTPDFYLWEEKEEQQKNKPCLIVLGNMVYCLAPRVENE